MYNVHIVYLQNHQDRDERALSANALAFCAYTVTETRRDCNCAKRKKQVLYSDGDKGSQAAWLCQQTK